jgi:hypothetical protein
MIEEPVTSVASNGCGKTSDVEASAFRSSTEPFQDAEESDREVEDEDGADGTNEDDLEDGDEDDSDAEDDDLKKVNNGADVSRA